MAGMIPSEVDEPKTVIADVPADTEMVEVPVDEATVPPRDTEPLNPDDDDMEESNVTEEEQEAYRAFVEAGFELIYSGGKVNPGILAMLDDDPADLIAVLGEIPEISERFSPIVALAATSVMVTMEVVRSMDAKPDGDIIMHGGRALLEDLAFLSGTEFEQDEMNQAMLHAVDIYRSAAGAEGWLDDEEASAEFAEILNAQEEGRIEEMLPGIERVSNGDR